MAAHQTQQFPGVNPETLLNLVSSILEPKSPTLPLPPPQRWDRLIRQALNRILGPSPDPWRLGPSPLPWIEQLAAGFRPPPLPWAAFADQAPDLQPISVRYRFLVALAGEVINRVELFNDLVVAVDDGEERGIIVVGGYVSRFADDFCGTGFRLPWLRPGPPPPWWFEELTAADLFVLGGQFAQAAKESFDGTLNRTLSSAAAKFASAGAARLQGE
jgi:hypothetical protein